MEQLVRTTLELEQSPEYYEQEKEVEGNE